MSDVNDPSTAHLLAKPTALSDGVTLQTPLSRQGSGPGLLILLPGDYQGASSASSKKTLDPEPHQKWAEEGFAVVQVKVTNLKQAEEDCILGIKALKDLPQCASFDRIGVVGQSNIIRGTFLDTIDSY